ncbi:DUF3126 family protein [Pelagibacterium halotolerans]|uniref:DUF3126 family protein n=1 Tax=Pelagibacterium halotolerans TaxID=531813 RepID=UPI00384F6FD1
MKHEEIILLQKYLQKKFGNRSIDVRPRAKQDDSVELYLGDEFIGLIYVDEDEGEKSYMVQISILDIDLDEVS